MKRRKENARAIAQAIPVGRPIPRKGGMEVETVVDVTVRRQTQLVRATGPEGYLRVMSEMGKRARDGWVVAQITVEYRKEDLA